MANAECRMAVPMRHVTFAIRYSTFCIQTRADINQEVRAGDTLDSTSPIVEYQSESDHAFSR